MNTFAVVFICIQACLVQSVFTQCASRAAISDTAFGGYGFAAPALAAPYGFAAPSLVAPFGLTGPTLAAPVGIAAPGLAYDGLAYGASYGAGLVPYGGIGEGNVAVAGELPVAGTTAVAGQVPIMGAVGFSGPVAAAGTVSIAGQCACGYGAPYNYII